MPQEGPKPGEFRVSSLSTRHPTAFEIRPDANLRNALSQELNISAIRKLRFAGDISANGAQGWVLRAELGATVVQPCVISLAPVTTRIDETVERFFQPPGEFDQYEADSETEMSEDTSVETLGTTISAFEVMVESLSLALPVYPRAPDAVLEQTDFAEEGIAPLTDEDVKPFAGLASLRDQMTKKSE